MPGENESATEIVTQEKSAAQADQARAENRLDQSEQWLRMLIDSAEDYAIFAINPQGKICTWNKGAQNLFGYSEAEIVGQDFALLFTPEDREQGVPKSEVEQAQAHGYSPDERWHLRKDGSRLFVSGAVRPLRDRQNHVRGFLKVAHDITQKKEAENLQAQYRALFESAPGLYLVVAPPDYRIIAASDAYLRATMTERQDVIGKHLFDVFPDDPSNPKCEGKCNLQASFERVVRERRRDIMPVQYYPIRRPTSQGNGFEERWWSPINTPVYGADGKVMQIIHRVEDVTPFVRRLQAEGKSVGDFEGSDRRLQQMAEEIVLRGQELNTVNQELRQSREELARANEELEARVRERTARLTEKVHELERFSYSLSHDMRAPLRAMQSFAQILLRDFSGRLGEQGAELLRRIASAAARLDQLIQDVLSVSLISRERIEPRPVDLDKLLRDMVHERASFQSPHAKVEIRGPLLPVLGHEASLSQCFSNLLDNAVKFVAPGISPHIRIWSEGRDGKVRVWVEDNGIGIQRDHHERIFGMFQRLHGNERYAGTGIGLAIVRKAVERMGGQVGVESKPSEGSRFWLELPRA